MNETSDRAEAQDTQKVVLIGGERYLSIDNIMDAFAIKSKNTALKYLHEAEVPRYYFGNAKLVRYRESDVAQMVRRAR